MAIDFPNSPSNGETFTVGDLTWVYSSGKWTIVSGAVDSLVLAVTHGANAGQARPTGANAVYWKGNVAPTNAINGDLWYDTTGD